MSAEARIYQPHGITPKTVALLSPPDRAFVEKAVGGRAERVRGFDHLYIDGDLWHCLAFRRSNAKGSGQPLNSFLDNLWKKTVNKGHGSKLSFLYGPILVVTGDDEFLDLTAAAWP